MQSNELYVNRAVCSTIYITEVNLGKSLSDLVRVHVLLNSTKTI